MSLEQQELKEAKMNSSPLEMEWVKVENGFEEEEAILKSGDKSNNNSNKSIDRSDDPSDNAVTKDQIESFRNEFEHDTSSKVAQNACRDASVHRISMDRDILLKSNDFTFNTLIDMDDMRVTNQNSSGRCWLFAALNLLRIHAASSNKLDVNNFEFSQAYIHFWDKLEKANAFLQAMIETSNLPLDDRTVTSLLGDPIGDGGWWMMATNLIGKYGLVPKSVYPESYTSKNTSSMNKSLEYLLINAANELRVMAATSTNYEQDAQAYKEERLADVYRVLCIHLGTPPDKFHWQWRDKHGKFHDSPGQITPLRFANEMIGDLPFQNYVSLVHDPRHEYYQRYTVNYSQTVLGCDRDIIKLNVPIEEMKKVAKRMLQDAGQPIWFACNVGEEFAETPGLWDKNLYNLEQLYGVKKLGFDMSKEDRIRFGYPMGTHAMLLTGCDIVDDDKGENNDGDSNKPPRRWKVENSWGTDGGHDGYYTLNDNWFDEFVFVLVAAPECLTDKMKEGLKTEPIVLPAWDPMDSSRSSASRRIRVW